LEELSREELIALVVLLRATNLALEERVRRLERQVSRNSENSLMPPSSDDLPGRPHHRRSGRRTRAASG
jgi:hypothetical protein